jgi:hypothetical protein
MPSRSDQNNMPINFQRQTARKIRSSCDYHGTRKYVTAGLDRLALMHSVTSDRSNAASTSSKYPSSETKPLLAPGGLKTV